ncbi:pyruvate, phosphate dikinase, partial [Lentzea sp. PSKA42]
MKWIRRLSADTGATAETIGGKAHGLVVLHRLGLPVPAGFVVTTEACRSFLRDGRLPDGLGDELRTAITGLEAATGRDFGGARRPLVVSVRSGASVSMPGMMNTILNLGLTAASTAALAAETGDERFALESRRRFLAGFDRRVPDDATGQLGLAVETVFSSWDTPRARTYRELHDVPHDLGTAAIVQTMVFGNRDEHSGTGVAFSRDPNTGADFPFGEVLFGQQGEDVVSGRSRTLPLPELADREPAVWAGLLDALRRIEEHYRDACYVEFTFEAGELWLLQVRPGRFAGTAGVRVATDLAESGVIERHEALLRVSPQHLRHVRTPRIATEDADVIAIGLGACPGVATGRVATTSDQAVRMAAAGPVVLM